MAEIAAKVCNRCGRERPIGEFRFASTYRGKRYRSPHCADCHRAETTAYRQANLEVVRAKDRARARRDPEMKRDRAHMGRARKYGAKVVEFVRRREIYERDAGVCHVCGHHVAWGEYQMDHVVPLGTEGGDHTYANIKTSHRKCNHSRRRFLRAAVASSKP